VPGLGVLPLATRAERAATYDRLVARIERAEEEAAARLVNEVIGRCAVPPGPGSAILDWDELAALAAEGVAIGPHTRHHPILSQATPERVQAEVAGSWADLQAHIARPLPIFCYPNGNHNDAVVRVLREQGIRLAFTTLSGPNKLDSLGPLRLRRTMIMPRTTPAIFRLRLLRLGIHLDAWRERKQRDVLTRGLPEYRTHHV
jgi:peptidoglycan/xylan/chitin deacetylase (PgdA/CDA1 family)